MKKILLFVAVLTLALLSCEEDKKVDVVGIASLDSIPAIEEICGIVGEGTSMHALELLVVGEEENRMPDSLYFFYEGNVVGGLQAGDQVAVLYSKVEGELVASLIVNMSSLEHLWRVDGTGGKQNIEINDKGRISTYGMDNAYSQWSVALGQLILSGTNEADTFDISLLTNDSLIIENDEQKLVMSKQN